MACLLAWVSRSLPLEGPTDQRGNDGVYSRLSKGAINLSTLAVGLVLTSWSLPCKTFPAAPSGPKFYGSAARPESCAFQHFQQNVSPMEGSSKGWESFQERGVRNIERYILHALESVVSKDSFRRQTGNIQKAKDVSEGEREASILRYTSLSGRVRREETRRRESAKAEISFE